jgi:Tol biopolymer transport system component
MMRARVVAISAAAILAATACGGSGSGSKQANRPILVNNSSPSRGGIFRWDSEEGLVRLSSNPRDYFPTWSHDRKRIAFERPFGRRGASHLFVMNADGTGAHQIGSVVTDSSAFGWSPDDDQIVFGDGASPGISVVNPDRTGLKKLLAKEGSEPAWSPDGETIVFRRLPEGLFVMRSDGTEVRRLLEPPRGGTKHFYNFNQPSWSPDGKRIVFVKLDILALIKPHPATLELMNADGSDERTLTEISEVPVDAVHPTWSPDGHSIVYADRHGDTYGIWSIDSAGGTARHLFGDEGYIYSMPSSGPAGA